MVGADSSIQAHQRALCLSHFALIQMRKLPEVWRLLFNLKLTMYMLGEDFGPGDVECKYATMSKY